MASGAESAEPARDEVAVLVRSAQAGDRDAFGVLYARFGRFVHGILLARLPSDEARDLVQDVFLQALERLRTLREPRAFAGWLATIARNRATDAHRQRPRTEPLEDLAGPVDPIEARADAQRVLALVQQLPEAYRETLVLRLVEGLSGPEIAGLTGLTPDSVRVNLHRGFKLLRERLGVTP
ncbi:MAG: RNA polymerase sigma factor [Vicinamibacterales bacterium]